MIQDSAGVYEELTTMTMKETKVLTAWQHLESLWLGENFTEQGKEHEQKEERNELGRTCKGMNGFGDSLRTAKDR